MPAETEDAELLTTECQRCANDVPEEDAFTVDGEQWCENCTNNHAFSCNRCDGAYPANDSRAVGRETWCEECHEGYASTCDDCGDSYHHSLHDWGRNAASERVCYSCSESYFYCEVCNETYHNDDYGSEGRCVDCSDSDEDEDTGDGIASYSTKPSRTPWGKGPHFYGVELEVEAGEQSPTPLARECRELLGGLAIVKSDGSLNNGFEIVTRPASLEEQLKHWEPFFDDRPSVLKSFNTKTCGLHVHTSRAPLSELSIAKIVCFVNAAHNRRFIRVIAGRDSANWARCKHKKLSDGNKYNPRRYEAVNLQNAATIEFRIFKGTLKKESVYKAIEFVDALVAFCAPAGRSLRESMSRCAFTKDVEENTKRWPHLAAFLDAKWFGRETKATEAFGFKPAMQINDEEQEGEN